MAATETPAVLDTQKMAHPALAPLYERIQAAASNKLWHQTTVALEELTKDKIFSAPGNTDLLALYSDFIADQPSGSAWPGFASKMSALRLATIGIAVSKQHPDSEEGSAAAIALLEGIGAKLTADKEASLLLKLEVARRTLQAGRVDEARSQVEDAKDVYDDLSEIDTAVSSALYLVSSLVHKTLGNAREFYTASLLYLAFMPLEALSTEQQQALAFDLGLAALCAEKTYQFGELLLHPILASLRGTSAEWLVGMLEAFNTGDIKKFEEVSTRHAAAVQKQPALVGNAQMLREKIRIFALMELVRDMPADSRTVSFAAIAERTALPAGEVELLLMKALSLSLIKGVICGVDSTVNVTWVQPRVMSREALGRRLDRLGEWMDKVQRTSVFLQNETPEILA